MDLLVNVLNQLGFEATKPQGSFFLYVAAPKSANIAGKKFAFETSEAFSQWLIKEELISTVPWDDCGNFVRFSVTFATQGEAAEKSVIAEIGHRLSKYNFEF